MSLSVGELVGTLRLDDRGFTRGVEDAKGRMRGLGDTGVQTSDRMGASWKQLAATAAASFAALKLADFAKDSISAAASLEQAVGGTEAVFGEASGSIDAFAEHSATSLGLSERAFRDLTTRAGGQLKNLGFSVDEAASKSIELTRIGADLAATYGGSTQEAVEALGAAFRGEADPAERFGLSLNITAQNAKAVELGLAASTSEVSAQARAQATLALITEQSADAQGQFGREADTASGQAARLAAQWEDMQADLGQKLLPILTKSGQVLSGVLGSGAASAGIGVAALAGAVLVAVPKLSEMRSTIAGMEGGFGKLAKVAGVAGAAGAVVGLVGALDAMEEAKNAENIRDMAEAFVAMGDSVDKSWEAALRSWAGPMIVKDVFDQLRDSNVEAAERFIDTAEAAGIAGSVIDDMRSSLDRKRDADAQAQVDQEAYTESVEAGTEAIEGQAGAVEELTDALDDLLSRFFSVSETVIAQNDLIAGVDEKLKELREEYGSGAMSLDVNTEAGRRNAEMLQELFEATGDTITAMDESGSTSEELRAQWAADRAELSAVIERFRAAGVDVSAYDALLAEVDRMVSTKVMADTAKAWNDISAVGLHLSNLDGKSATVKVFRKFFDELPGSMWNFGGGRALGGPVEAGSIYEVTEGGVPELLREGGRTYLLPGIGGQVETIGEAMSRAGGYATPGPAPMGMGMGGGGQAGSVLVQVDVTGGDDQLMRWLKDRVRTEGRGNVQIALGAN